MSDPIDIEKLRQEYLAELGGSGDSADATDSDRGETSAPLSAVDETSFDDTVRAQLDLLADEEAATDDRMAAIATIAAAAFQSRAFAPFRAEFVETLRRVADGPEKELRFAALDHLTLMDDPEAARMLRASLSRTRDLLVPTAMAVQLLARNDHGDAAPLFRELARRGSGPVRDAAVRALASDAHSAPLLAEITADKSERTSIRQSAALSLKELAPEMFTEVAQSVVLDPDDDDRLRATALSAITHTPAVADRVDTAKLSAGLDLAAERATPTNGLRTEMNRFAGRKSPETP